MDSIDTRHQNDIDALTALHKYGWLRTQELGYLLWPDTKNRGQTQACRAALSWLKRGLMMARTLPDGAGRALVLATAGVRLLADAGVVAVSGKDIGKMVGSTWTPPIAWKHHVIATGILVNLATSGWNVFPEATIRRKGELLAKIPDGLAVLGEKVIWLEVEQARKTGPSMRLLGQALVAVSESEIEPVCGYRANIACCAYVIDEIGRAHV